MNHWISILLALACLALDSSGAEAVDAGNPRGLLLKAVLAEDPAEQVATIRKLAESGDESVARALSAWRAGELFIHEGNDGARTPFLLDSQRDADGAAKGLRLLDGQPIRDESGEPVIFMPFELVPADADSKLRKEIQLTLDLFDLSHPNPKIRRDAAVKLGQERNPEHTDFFQARFQTEENRQVRKALEEAIALTQTRSEDPTVRRLAIEHLGALRSITSLPLLKQLLAEPASNTAALGEDDLRALRRSIRQIEDHLWRGNLIGTTFRGLSLSAVLLVAAIGLAITFGLMGVINMAHGEIMLVGAYAVYVTQNLFKSWFGQESAAWHGSFPVAVAMAFLAAATVGLVLERSIIRFLYKRPLESLLATWGASLLLRQVFRHIFGAANVQVVSPSWLSGSLEWNDVLFAYNRLFVIGFALAIVAGTWLVLTRTTLGLQIRAVMQNRAMASCLGVRTERVNMMTFALGSGLAGMAGACLSQIGNVGPGLGQSYIVDCFMIVVLGGVGNLAGTVSAAMGVGMTDQILQPWLGAVMGKITVLGAVILFLQWRPAGLFATRSRSLES